MRQGQPHVILELEGRTLRLYGRNSMEIDQGKDALGVYRWQYLPERDVNLALRMLTYYIRRLLEPQVPAESRATPYVAYTFDLKDSCGLPRHYRIVRVPLSPYVTSLAEYVAESKDFDDRWWALTDLNLDPKADAVRALAYAYVTLADQAGALVIQGGTQL